MDGVHDLGGVNGFGVVRPEPNEPVFHESWEPIGYALIFVGAGELKAFTIDELRHAIERMDPRHYLTSSYYERIVTGVAALFVEKGYITHETLEAKAGGRFPLALPVTPGERARDESLDLQPGDAVAVRSGHFRGHARMPRYVRGKRGTILHRTTHAFPFAGSAGHGIEAKLEPTYHVKFEAKDLWSDAADNSSVVVDLWESYLEKI
ncbi:nitrile hydratase [Panacagrimonas perspica]|uniref:Nitrile hydratase subunit beta n=1 Tax=Panacagrimonas perspica TaxID=381431 RepID=A0A4S3K311_9GAMM|nr:nitrile hydratase subunit beta [Panacagrimonas perspica]TDU28748.1 nitrile hydratase [Panacagrimonas perspica]THD02410.1 nitrile hydratase subunit beta [Panacagrimonas perspica]